MTQSPAPAALLDATGVAKRFGAVVALRDASLRVAPGQIVALMGANGAGKSTFVKILTGALKPDSGHVRIRGQDSTVASPAGARRSGLVPVYQEPSLIPDLSVRDNLRLGDTPVDIEEGRQAGCAASLVVTNGTHSREELEPLGPDGLLNSLRELPEWLKFRV